MSTDVEAENSAYIRHGIEQLFNRGNLTVADERFADDIRLHSPASAEPIVGRDQVVEFIVALRVAFPDLHVEIEDLIAADDRVVTRCTTTGTHLGDYFGTPPTGHRVRINEVQIFRITDTRLVDLWLTFDVLGVLVQMGLIPASGMPAPVMHLLAWLQRRKTARGA
ncbi:MAG TPA: ester cyclase [Euzebya sp.]|nr:ester cyclase [Euzebya sp.]